MNKAHLFISRILCLLCLSIFAPVLFEKTASGFDGASEIYPSYLQSENFLDHQSYQFHKLKEEEWYESQEGWRLSGGSIGMDLLYQKLNIKLAHLISENTMIRFLADQEEFYEIKPFRFLVELEWQATSWGAVSFLGMPEYDKRHADEGGSITLGKRPWNYLRFQQLGQNLFYNEKNLYDKSYYSPNPLENRLEGALHWNQWKFRFNHFLYYPHKQIFPETGMTFQHQGHESSGMLDYHLGTDQWVGLSWFDLEIQKERQQSTATNPPSPNNRSQKILWVSKDLYWLQPLNSKFHGTFGLREDAFLNEFRQLDQPADSADYTLWTFQLYGFLRHQTAADRFWEYGLYAGDSDFAKDFLVSDSLDEHTRTLEVKLRISWEWMHLEKQASLIFTTTWNIDDFFNNFWDGGHMGYQRTF